MLPAVSEHEAEPEAPDQTEPVDDEHELVEHVDDEPLDDEAEHEADAEHAGEQEASSQKVLAAMDRENNRHARAWAKLVEVEVEELHECPTCDGIGFTPEPVAGESELQHDPFTETCPRCAGYGEVLTGAKASALATIPCPGCGSTGYVQKQEHPEAGAAPGNGAPAATLPPPSYFPDPSTSAHVAELRAAGYVVVEPTEPVATPST